MYPRSIGDPVYGVRKTIRFSGLAYIMYAAVKMKAIPPYLRFLDAKARMLRVLVIIFFTVYVEIKPSSVVLTIFQ